ncbi:MAG: hypothetical protein NVS9B4_10110 [Candidatus Acidiferrum sp.]
MILRLSSPAVRAVFVAISIFFAAFLSYSSIGVARATYFSDLQTLNGAERATELQPRNATYWYLLARQLHYDLENPNLPRAILLYRKSLDVDPLSSDAWLDLAGAYEAEGDLPAARDAFVNAQHVYPLSADVPWRYGNFLLRQGQLDTAFTLIRQALDRDPLRAAEAFSRCIRAQPDADLVIDRILPPSRDVYLAVMRNLIEEPDLGTSLKIWDRLVAIHPSLRMIDVFFLVEALRRSQDAANAQRVWQQATDLAGLTVATRVKDSLVWDGGFESGVLNGGYAWYLPQAVRNVEARLDSQEKHSGNQSVRVTFDSSANLDFLDVCQFVPVQPSTAYHLSAWVQTRALSTDQGVRFQVNAVDPASSALAQSPQVHGTHPWTLVESRWTTLRTTHEIHVCLARSPSDQPENKIGGALWIDDVSIVPDSPGKSAP